MAAKKLRKMLGTAQSPHIVSLMRLIETQSKATIAKWCLDYAEANVFPIFETRYPGDGRPRRALMAARDWFEGRKKLKEVKNIILNECHCWYLQDGDLAFAKWVFDHDGVIGLSKALQTGSKVRVLSGPMKDYEGSIIRIDRHARSGIIAIAFDNNVLNLKLSFELVKEI